MRKTKRISALLLAALLLFGICMPNGLISTAYAADDYAMKFTFNGTQYTVIPGQTGSGAGVSWSCDTANNVSLLFTQSGKFRLDEGDVTNAEVTVIGGGAGGTSGGCNRTSNLRINGSGGAGGGGGQELVKAIAIAELSEHSVVIGAGGIGGSPNITSAVLNGMHYSASRVAGTAGGASSWDSVTANGGQPGAGGNGPTDVAQGYAQGGNASNPRDGGGGGVASYFDEDSCGNFRNDNLEWASCWICCTCKHNPPQPQYGPYGTETGRTQAYQATAGNSQGGSGANGSDGMAAGGKGANAGNGQCGNCPLQNGADGIANSGGGGGGGSFGTRMYWSSAKDRNGFYAMTNSGYAAGFSTKGGNGGSGAVRLRLHAESSKGTMTLTKSSENASITDGNSCYSLEGAAYGIYPTQNDAAAGTNRMALLTTDANGKVGSTELKTGTYYVKELTAPKGFALDPQVHPVSIEKNKNTEFTCKDIPITDPIDILLKKTDAATGTGVSSGQASLEGAEFTFRFYPGNFSTVAEAKASGSPKYTWVYKTNSVGFISVLDDSGCFVSGSPLIRNGAGDVTFPLGTLIIQETKAPEHYQIDSTEYLAHITQNGSDVNLIYARNTSDIPNTLTHAGVTVTKRDSAYPDSVKTQGNAVLSGAEFSIINNNESAVTVNGTSYKKGDTVAVLTTNEKGVASSAKDLLPLGNYIIKETKAPEGYALNSKWSAEFSVTDEVRETIIKAGSMTDDVIKGTVTVQKKDSQTGLILPQGDGSFEGAVFKVINISKNSVIFNGSEIAPNEAVTTITTNEKGIASVDGLPYGQYKLEEVSIPTDTGYTVNTAWTSTVTISSSGTVNADNCAETLGIYSGLEVQKVDFFRDAAAPEGDASLEGAVFEIYNASKQSVYVSGKIYNVGSAITTITTNADGLATLNPILPIGTYQIREITPSRGYLLNSDWVGTAEIRNNGETIRIAGANACKETPITGGVSVQKLDKDTGTNRGIGGMEMKNAEFTIINRSKAPIVYGGKEIAPFEGQFDRDAAYTDGIVCRIYTNEDGFASTGAHDLPFGSYEIFETDNPTGYQLNEEWSKSFDITDDGLIISFDGNDACVEELSRTDIHFQKVNATIGKTIPNVFFKVTHVETGEVHYIVTDPNGVYDSSLIPHSQKTNGNDAAINPDGSVDESKLSYECGTWFGGDTPVDERPNGDKLGAFIYGTYHFEEIRTSANKGLLLVEFDKIVYAKNGVMDFGDVEDHVPEELETILTDAENENHYITPGETVTLYDTVVVHNCVVGREYTLEATLMEKDTNAVLRDAKGNPVTATYQFTAIGAEMTLNKKISFRFDSELLTGSDLVCFEKLTNGADHIYAVHEDIDDESQTVKVPVIRTTAKSEENDKFIFAGEDAVIIDTIVYENLIPNKTIKMHARLADKATGEFIKDSKGEILEAVKSFKPTEEDGTFEMEIRFDASGLKGTRLVVFEYAYLAGTDSLIAVHEDINDEDQTVSVLKICTAASNEKNSENKAVAAAPETRVYDRVDYSGLLPDTEYTLSGILCDAETGELIDKDDPSWTASTTFTTDDSGSGSVYVVFTVDSSELAGKALVAFERLYAGEDTSGKLLADDIELPNAPETVYIPKISTTATTDTGSHTSPAAETVVIHDEVRYTNLYPSHEYRIEGKLVDKDSGETVKNSEGREITASKVFTPTKADGSEILTFTLDASELGGKSVVAFETLEYRNLAGEYRYLTDHSDKNDEEQTVRFPELYTNAASVDGIQVIKPEGTVTVIDTVHVVNAVVGSEYIFRGTMVDSEGRELKNLTKPETVVIAEKSNFDVELTFTLDAKEYGLEGHSYTVFEKMLQVQNGHELEIACHEELEDETQMVWFPSIDTTAAGKEGEKQIIFDSFDAEVTIVDTVTYSALQPGKTYVLTGTLMNKATGEPLKNDEGKPITASRTFKPDSEEGSVELEFKLLGKHIAGQKTVAFERITTAGVLVAVHEDIQDEDQTVECGSVGKILKYNGTTEEPLAGVVITVKDETSGESFDVATQEDGYASFVVFAGHSYSFIEKTPLNGYMLNTEKQTFTVGTDGNMSAEAKLINLWTGTVVLSKVDALTNTAVPGAVIAVYRKEGSSYIELFRQTTDEYGRIYFYPGEMIGTFYFREVSAPAGYYLDDDIHSFTIKSDLTVTGQTRFVNAPIGTVVLKKASESGDYLQGAKYGVYDWSGKQIVTDITDEYGRIYFVTPSAGSYYFVELEAPKGYLKNDAKNYFAIDTSGNVTGTTKLVDKSDGLPSTGDQLGSGKWMAGMIFFSFLTAAGVVVLIRSRKKKEES